MPGLKIMGLPVLEEKIVKSFYHIWAWWPSWSCDQDDFYKIYVPSSKEGSVFNFILIGLVV